jgi:hypothetical protein
MMDAIEDRHLFVIAECPASPGFGCVVALKAVSTGRLVYCAPCCGIAWRKPPLSGRLDEISSPEQLELGPLAIPTLEDLRTAGVDQLIIRQEPLDRWVRDLPESTRT